MSKRNIVGNNMSRLKFSLFQNGYSEVIAAPGVEDWRGEWNRDEKKTGAFMKEN